MNKINNIFYKKQETTRKRFIEAEQKEKLWRQKGNEYLKILNEKFEFCKFNFSVYRIYDEIEGYPTLRLQNDFFDINFDFNPETKIIHFNKGKINGERTSTSDGNISTIFKSEKLGKEFVSSFGNIKTIEDLISSQIKVDAWFHDAKDRFQIEKNEWKRKYEEEERQLQAECTILQNTFSKEKFGNLEIKFFQECYVDIYGRYFYIEIKREEEGSRRTGFVEFHNGKFEYEYD